jgi:flagellar biosynthetic protein FliQ
MPMETVVELGRRTLEAALMVVAPILLVATVVSLTVNVIQVLTSIQEMTIATVPRLLATAAALLLLMPWMLRRLAQFTLQILSNFRPYLG